MNSNLSKDQSSGGFSPTIDASDSSSSSNESQLSNRLEELERVSREVINLCKEHKNIVKEMLNSNHTALFELFDDNTGTWIMISEDIVVKRFPIVKTADYFIIELGFNKTILRPNTIYCFGKTMIRVSYIVRVGSLQSKSPKSMNIRTIN